QQMIARLRPKLEKVEGARLYMQAAQDVRLGGRPTRTQFEFTLQDANLGELNEWAPKILAKMQTLPELRDVATDQQTQGTSLDLRAGASAVNQPSGPIPCNHHQRQPRPGRGARTGDASCAEGDGRPRRARHLELKFPGNSPGVSAVARYRSAADHGGAGRGVS